MQLMTQKQERKMVENNRISLAGNESPEPVIKLFTPDAACTWFFSDYDPDSRMFFGLCDLGMGFPEMGYAHRDELEALRGGLGLPVERDLHWTPKTFNKLQEEIS